jgi:hypothetical protein
MRRLLPALALVLACALAPASAHANDQQLSIMMDDDLLLYRGDNVRDEAMKRMKNLGVDYVRVTVLWEVAAHQARSTRKRKRKFRAENPATYPIHNWDRYDRLVEAGRTLGVGVYFNVTGPGPRWAHAKPPRRERSNRRTWKPKAREFHKFVKALGRRYDGTYRDENDNHHILPRVGFWSLWNEPNQGGWLTPQYERGRPSSPRLYRELWYHGRAALTDTGHGGDVILAGETAPLGSNGNTARSPMRPKRFIRELACVDSRGRSYRGSAARVRGCSLWSKLQQMRYTAWAHHPYTKDLAPTRRDSNKDSITMANIGELTGLLDQLAAKRGFFPPLNNSVLTEFGYETDPPDRHSGLPLEAQARYLNIGDYLAYKNPRVFGNTQFLLRDVAPLKGRKGKARWFTYQSGIFFHDGRPKPSASTYIMPFHSTGTTVDSVGATVNAFWGQVRFWPNNAETIVYLQYRARGRQTWDTVGDPVRVRNTMNFWEATAAVRGSGTWRAVWLNPFNGTPTYSREIEVG